MINGSWIIEDGEREMGNGEWERGEWIMGYEKSGIGKGESVLADS